MLVVSIEVEMKEGLKGEAIIGPHHLLARIGLLDGGVGDDEGDKETKRNNVHPTYR